MLYKIREICEICGFNVLVAAKGRAGNFVVNKLKL